MGRYFSASKPDDDRSPEEDLERAEMMLRAVKAQDEEVAQLGAALRQLNIRNHYGARLEESMRRAHR